MASEDDPDFVIMGWVYDGSIICHPYIIKIIYILYIIIIYHLIELKSCGHRSSLRDRIYHEHPKPLVYYTQDTEQLVESQQFE